MTDIVKRLRGYNPPDRTIDEQRQLATDISEAADEIERLQAALKGMLMEWDKFTRYGSPIAKAANERVNAARAALLPEKKP